MKIKKIIFIFWIISGLLSYKISAQQNKSRVKFYGSIRLRTELNKTTGINGEDNEFKSDFLKYRFRFGLRYYKKHWGAGARIRSGEPAFPQNSDVEFGNSFKGTQLFIDKAFIQYKNYGFKAWIGKNTLNIWQPDQLMWDVDVNPEGVALTQNIHFYRIGDFKIYGGYYVFDYDNDPQTKPGIKNSIAIAQLKYRNYFFNFLHLSIASGWLHTGFEQTDNWPDYEIFFSYLTLQNGRKNLKLIFDFFHNFNNDSPFIKPSFENQNTGYSVEAQYRFWRRKFTARLKYAYLERYAVIDRLAQNDWIQNNFQTIDSNGNVTYRYTLASNFSGINLSLVYKISPDIRTRIEFWTSEILQAENSISGINSFSKIRGELVYKF